MLEGDVSILKGACICHKFVPAMHLQCTNHDTTRDVNESIFPARVTCTIESNKNGELKKNHS